MRLCFILSHGCMHDWHPFCKSQRLYSSRRLTMPKPACKPCYCTWMAPWWTKWWASQQLPTWPLLHSWMSTQPSWCSLAFLCWRHVHGVVRKARAKAHGLDIDIDTGYVKPWWEWTTTNTHEVFERERFCEDSLLLFGLLPACSFGSSNHAIGLVARCLMNKHQGLILTITTDGIFKRLESYLWHGGSLVRSIRLSQCSCAIWIGSTSSGADDEKRNERKATSQRLDIIIYTRYICPKKSKQKRLMTSRSFITQSYTVLFLPSYSVVFWHTARNSSIRA